MPSSRTRLLALTCALAATLSLTGVATAPTTAAPVAGSVSPVPGAHRGLDRLLADGTPNGRAIVTFDAVPTTTQVGALRALGLTVQPMSHLPLALVEGPVPAMAQAV